MTAPKTAPKSTRREAKVADLTSGGAINELEALLKDLTPAQQEAFASERKVLDETSNEVKAQLAVVNNAIGELAKKEISLREKLVDASIRLAKVMDKSIVNKALKLWVKASGFDANNVDQAFAQLRKELGDEWRLRKAKLGKRKSAGAEIGNAIADGIDRTVGGGILSWAQITEQVAKSKTSAKPEDKPGKGGAAEGGEEPETEVAATPSDVAKALKSLGAQGALDALAESGLLDEVFDLWSASAAA